LPFASNGVAIGGMTPDSFCSMTASPFRPLSVQHLITPEKAGIER
jgi:hypothetical protein